MERVEAMKAEINATDDQQFEQWEKYPRCALLPSPEKLDISMNSPGSDVTDTLEDFKQIKNWVEKNELLNTGFYNNYREQDKQLEKDSFKNAVKLAFSTAFHPMRNTRSPELEELVFWYYAGHGLGKETAKPLVYSSTPYLSKVGLNPNCNDDAIVFDFVKEERKVKGGELCLHMGGFCDLYGLLKPWIAAVKSESKNAPGQKKKNKHLVAILDSCHSGIIAQELKKFEKQVRKKDESFLKENSVTIQAACGPNERTFGGYFTPLFLYLNDPRNNKRLEQLKEHWRQMTEEEKKKYKLMELPSPTVETTRTECYNVTMEINVQNFKLTLFPDAGFFKFCSFKVFEYRQAEALVKERALYRATVQAFMKSKSFQVLDYKLKTFKGTGHSDGKHAGTPMGLFLLDHPDNPGFAVCAHVHFKAGSTDVNDVQRINLVHHRKPPGRSIEYVEDGGKFQVNIHKTADAARELVKACRQYVNTNEPGRWNNVSQWNMTGGQLSVNGKFRLNERSAWEQSYLTAIKKYKLPEKVPANSWHRFALLSSFFVLFAISFHFYLNMRA